MEILLRVDIESDSSIGIETNEKQYNFCAIPQSGGHSEISYYTPLKYIEKCYGSRLQGIKVEGDTISLLTDNGAITICATSKNDDVEWRQI